MNKLVIKTFVLVIAVVGLSIQLKAQQATGQFILMDGGLEGQIAANLTLAKSYTAPLKTWGRYSTKKTATYYAVSNVGARTGNNFIVINDTSNSSSSSIISPALQPGAIVGNASYIVQLYYRAHDLTNLPNTGMEVGVSNATKTAAKFTKLDSNAVVNNAVWLKSITPVVAANGATPDSGFFIFKVLAGTALSPTSSSAIDLDDIVIYTGTAADTIAPPNAGNVAVGGATGTTLNVNWGAASTVDSGGYMVVRYSSDPTGQPDPNPNGIYAIGNALGTGVVAYTGVDTLFTDKLLQNNTTYYYRVYTVDKAFNYASSSIGAGTTNTSQAINNYYIDSANGNDANDGRTPATAWQTIAKVNSTTFFGGDSVLFNCGDTWSGTTLHPLGSGISGSPIVVSKYGTGNLPQINGNTATSHNENAVYLYNEQYITLSNLDITNNYKATNTDTALRKGVYVQVQDMGTAHCITLKDLVIHDVLGTYDSSVYSGGIFCNITGKSIPTTFDSLLIDNCKVYNVDRTGISNLSSWAGARTISNSTGWYPSTNLVVQNCEVDSSGANSFIIRDAAAPVIQHNLAFKSSIRYTGNSIFVFNCDDALIQYNEASYNVFNKGDADASAYDADFMCHRTVIQYNYSHDNDGGAWVVVCDPHIAGTFDDSCVIRYNISQNDCHKNASHEYGIIRLDGNITNTTLYNNDIYSSKDFISAISHCAWGGGSTGVLPANSSYYNNIFEFNKNTPAFALNSSTGNLFDYNTFYYNPPYSGSHPTDTNVLTNNPLFVNPGTGGKGINSVDGYKLQVISPCIHSGVLLPNHATADYWGDSIVVTAGASPCRGAYEYEYALPVSLINLNGETVGNNDQLNWTTTEEINNAGFEVQHSADGQVFIDEYFVPTKTATGNYAGTINYTYTDTKAYAGVNYYRLKQIDKAGKLTYSSVIEISNKKFASNINVYPNPVTNKVINIQFNNQSANTYNVQLINNNGKIVARKQINHAGGTSLNTFDISSLNVKGSYFLKIASPEGETIKTILIK